MLEFTQSQVLIDKYKKSNYLLSLIIIKEKMMRYSIGQAAKITGLSTHTLRYYEKEGLLPFVKKSSSGLRIFTESDIGWINMIECLKGVGMSLKGIKQYIDWYQEGDNTLGQRLDMFIKQKQSIIQQMMQLHKHLEKINYKINLYNEAVKLGSLEQALHQPHLQKEKEKVYNAA